MTNFVTINNMKSNLKLLHVGAGNIKHEGLINLKKEDLDISKPWSYETESIDGIVSMQVLQQLNWRDLVVALRESYRVLKKGGVMRFGTLLIENEILDYLLGWNNINVFSFDLLTRVLEEVGFQDIRIRRFRETEQQLFAQVDNRHEHSSYIECIK